MATAVRFAPGLTGRAEVLLLLFALMLLTLTAGCHETYRTRTGNTDIAELRQKTLCLVSSLVDADMGHSGISVLENVLFKVGEDEAGEQRISETLGRQETDKIVETFDGFFQVVQPPSPAPILSRNQEWRPEAIAQRIQDSGADYGLVLQNSYGMSHLSFGIGIGTLIFTTRATIYDREGREAWGFDGRANVTLCDFNLDALKMVFAATPTAISNTYDTAFDCYAQFLLKLLQEDARKTEHGDRIERYVDQCCGKFTMLVGNLE